MTPAPSPIQQLHEALTRLHVPHSFEEYDGDHTNKVRERIENHARHSIESPERKLSALRWVLEAEAFENFLGKRFRGEKRFSNEGGEGAMIILNAILEACPSHGVKEIEMGMSHRGRMNVLANFVRKSLTTVLHEFTPNYEPGLVAGDGDVKYHLGYESVRELPDGKVRVSELGNGVTLATTGDLVFSADAQLLINTAKNANYLADKISSTPWIQDVVAYALECMPTIDAKAAYAPDPIPLWNQSVVLA